jgi:hypothetical protein
MKSSKARIGILAACAFLASSSVVSAGIIDILRGETGETPFQRVAFVGAASVKEVQGEVQRLAGVEHWVALKKGDQLQPGDLLRTTSGSAVLSMLESESFVKVTPNTLCRLVALENGWDRAVLSGQEEREGFAVRGCRGNVYSRSADGSWTPLAVNAVLARGTQVRTERGALVDLFHTHLQRPLRISGSVETSLDERVLAQRLTEVPTLVAARP